MEQPAVLLVNGSVEVSMRALAHRSAGAHGIPVVDYLVAATAQEINATVLHYDAV